MCVVTPFNFVNPNSVFSKGSYHTILVSVQNTTGYSNLTQTGQLKGNGSNCMLISSVCFKITVQVKEVREELLDLNILVRKQEARLEIR
jgi:hypothetical protein